LRGQGYVPSENGPELETVPPQYTDLSGVGWYQLAKILHSVIDKVYNWVNLVNASAKVIANRGSAGVDGMDVKAWSGKHGEHLSTLRQRLMNDTYRSKGVKRTYIDKPDSRKKRPLGIPAIVDRVCQQSVHAQLGPVFEEYFHPNSYGFRPGRSTHSAADRVQQMKDKGYGYVVDLDIRGFFDHVDHEILMKLVSKVVKDRRVLGLIRGWLTAGVMEEGKIRFQTSGTPQGGVISPLLSNIYLTVLDNALAAKGHPFVRYADDVLIFCHEREQADQILAYVRQVLSKLKLELNEEKTCVRSFSEGFDFLGFHFNKRGMKVGTKSLKGLFRKVREVTRRQQGDLPLESVIERLNPILRGWGNYHKRGRNVGLLTRLDKWVRKRLRAYVHKRWRTTEGSPTNNELAQKGLLSMRSIIRPTGHSQLMLFEAPRMG
jgi:group II intron reverse transcriptase/maturase